MIPPEVFVKAERDRFERWVAETWMTDAEFDPERNCYVEFPVHMAWKGWQAALSYEG